MFTRRWRKRQPLKAVHDQDLEDLLASLNLLEDIKDGKRRCDICGAPLTLDNLGAIFPLEGSRIGLACDEPTCIKQVFLRQREGP